MSPLESTLDAFATQAATPQGASQLALIVAGLGLGWLAAGALRRRVAARQLWKFGSGGFDRVAFPLASLALIWGARLVLRKASTPRAVRRPRDLAARRLRGHPLRGVRAAPHPSRKARILRGTERTVAITILGRRRAVPHRHPARRLATPSIPSRFNVGKQRISLLLVMQGLVSVAVTLAISLWIARLVEVRVLAAERVEISTRVVVAKLVRALAFLLASSWPCPSSASTSPRSRCSAARWAWAWASACRRSRATT